MTNKQDMELLSRHQLRKLAKTKLTYIVATHDRRSDVDKLRSLCPFLSFSFTKVFTLWQIFSKDIARSAWVLVDEENVKPFISWLKEEI